jgi:alkanesulfonate monooxygenase SsuD/methylene tetrahydromethanopterin reductase-like flavin-dependent oxidoreductase (luciferase family)
MEIGVQLPEVERPVRWSEVREIARTIEDCGFDSIWVGDHLLYRGADGAVKGPWEAWTSLAALAEATERVRLGPLVAATSFHNPGMIAKFATTIDEISGGRLILGLGAGWNRTEYDAFGFPYGRRVARFNEAFTIIRTLIRQGSIDFDGEFYQLADMELLPRARPDMEMLIGSNGPRMLRIAVPHVDMWNSWFDGFGNRASGLEDLHQVVDEACADVGRDPQDIERTVAVYVQLGGGEGRQPGDSVRGVAPPITGTHEEIAAELRAFSSAGISHLQVVLDPIDPGGVEELTEIAALI